MFFLVCVERGLKVCGVRVRVLDRADHLSVAVATY